MSLTVAIPTYKNQHQLVDTLVSLVRNTDFSGRVLVINNGDACYEEVQGAVPYDIDWLEAGENLGWARAINVALERADTDFFCMLNDDVLFAPCSTSWWSNTLRWFDMPDVGGIGPSSNYVAGYQNAFMHLGHPVVTLPYLIGMCATYRTEDLKRLGGLDPELRGGDDLDISIRMIDSGKLLLADRRNYLHHHGSQTGRRVHEGYWDSQEHQLDTVNDLVRKHGLRRWWDMVNGEYSSHPSLFLKENHVAITRRGMQSNDETVDGLFARARTTPSDVNEHLDILYRYASGCRHVVEFGVADCTTTAAFLKARPERLDSYDIVRKPQVDVVERVAAREGIRFTFHEQSTMDAVLPDGVDMLYVDDWHTASHVARELALHAAGVRKYLAFHDVSLFDDAGEDQRRPGIWAPIAAFLRAHDEWRIVYSTEAHNGLVILARV